MKSVRRRAIGNTSALVLVVLTPLLLAGYSASSSTTAQAVTSHPACDASQITVTAGKTLTNATYAVRTTSGLHQVRADELVPVYFYNTGATCHLLMGAPQVLAVRNTKDVTDLATLSMHDVSIPSGAVDTRRRVVVRHQKIEALFVVVRPVAGPTFRGCHPATATGLLLQGYAGPIGTFHWIPRQLRDVCFDTGVGRSVVNFGINWPPA